MKHKRTQRRESDAPEFSADSLVWQADDRKGRPMSVIVDRAASMIHLQSCAIRAPFLLGWALPWFSCSLSDIRSFHIRPLKTGSNLVIKTDIGKVTVVRLDNCLPAILQTLDDAIPGGHRRFHEDHPLAILLFLLAGFSGAVLALFLIPDRLSPQTALTVVLGSGVAMTLAVRWAISFWSGRRRVTENDGRVPADGSPSWVESTALTRFGQTLGLIFYFVGVVLVAAFFCIFGGHAILTQHMAVKNGAPVTGIAALLVGSLFVALGVGLLIVMVRLLWKWCRRWPPQATIRR